MNKEIFHIMESVCNEKGLGKDELFDAMEEGLAAALKRMHGQDKDFRVDIDQTDGSVKAYRRWLVMDDEDEEFETSDRQTLRSYAKKDHPDTKVGEYIEEEVTNVPSGRIYAHAAKQVIGQKIREAERARVAEIYSSKIGSLVMGTVKRDERGGANPGIYLELEHNVEAFIPRDLCIPREIVRSGERIRAYLQSVREDGKGAELVLSRTAPEFLIELFKIEVPEIGQGAIEIISAARDPGLRAKLAVTSNDPRLDPVGACVGMRGSRVQAVSNELAGERIDIITWNENLANYVTSAMSPAVVVYVRTDEEKRKMEIVVEQDKLAKAIGRGGQNVRLASQLTGWELTVMSELESNEKREKELEDRQKLFADKLEIDETFAAILVDENFTTIEEIAYADPEELLQIEGIDKETCTALHERANHVLFLLAMSGELEQPKETLTLTEIEGIDKDLARKLAMHGVLTVEGLAEQSVDELLEIEGIDRKNAERLIMTARAPWFEEDE